MRSLLLAVVVAVAILASGQARVRGSEAGAGSTPQLPDVLLFESDTLTIEALPLEEYFSQGHARLKTFFPRRTSTACGRGYRGLWQIEDDRLYLRSVRSCSDFEKRLSPAKMDSLFPERRAGGLVFAGWYSGVLPSPQGEVLKYEHAGWGGIRQREIRFHIENGRLAGRDTVSNVPTRDPEFPGGLDSLRASFYRHLNWNAVGLSNSATRVFALVEVDTTGQMRVRSIARASSPAAEAAVRSALAQLPRWSIGYRRGRKIALGLSIPIPLSDSLRQAHAY